MPQSLLPPVSLKGAQLRGSGGGGGGRAATRPRTRVGRGRRAPVAPGKGDSQARPLRSPRAPRAARRSPRAPPLRAPLRLRLRGRSVSREGRPRPVASTRDSGEGAVPTEGSRAGPAGTATCCCVGSEGARRRRAGRTTPPWLSQQFTDSSAGLPWPHRRVLSPRVVEHRSVPGKCTEAVRASALRPRGPGQGSLIYSSPAPLSPPKAGRHVPSRQAVSWDPPCTTRSCTWRGHGPSRAPPPRPVQSGRRWRPGLGEGWPCPGGGARSREPGAERQGCELGGASREGQASHAPAPRDGARRRARPAERGGVRALARERTRATCRHPTVATG